MAARTADVIDDRTLNRTLLARHGLLGRTPAAALDALERLVGLQAQVPSDPYIALWSRIEAFDPAELSGLIEDRQAVRARLMRTTIHLVSARDCLTMTPLTLPVHAATFRSQFAKLVEAAPLEEVTAFGLELLHERPRTRAELEPALAERWPEEDAGILAHAVLHHCATVQLPPRGLWGRSGQARLAPTTQYLGAALDGRATLDDLVLRYLAAFGPASPADVRTWSRRTGLRDVVARLRPRLRVFRDARGRDLLDVEDGLLADPDTPAPPRFLPEYDNVLLGHDDRSRISSGLGPFLSVPRARWRGTLLVDGFYRAWWFIDGDGRLVIDGFTPNARDPGGTRPAVEAEAVALLALLAPGDEPRVEWRPRP